MRQDREHGFARRALYPPNGYPTHTDADVMRVTGEAPATTTGRLMFQLKAEGQDECDHEFDKRLAASITASATFGHSASPDNVAWWHIMARQGAMQVYVKYLDNLCHHNSLYFHHL